MARIRSVHPGLFTDEAFVSLSMTARILLIGLWTEADDHGAFEWKPLSIKMRVFPADSVDVPALMKELAEADVIRQHGNLGFVRNFCKYQRPKKPTYKHGLPDELRTYIACKPDGTEPVPHQESTGGENSALMEREDEVGEEEEPKRAKARGGPYEFDGGIIRLTRKHFDDWSKAFGNLDLRAELTARDAWLGSPRATDKDRGDWFISTSKYLANRNAEVRARGSPRRPTTESGQPIPAGII